MELFLYWAGLLFILGSMLWGLTTGLTAGLTAYLEDKDDQMYHLAGVFLWNNHSGFFGSRSNWRYRPTNLRHLWWSRDVYLPSKKSLTFSLTNEFNRVTLYTQQQTNEVT